MKRVRIFVVVASLGFVACETTSPRGGSSRSAPSAQPLEATAPQTQGSDRGSSASQQADLQDENCLPLAVDVKKIPHFMPDISIVVTGIQQSCQRSDGMPGYRAKSGWVAMGFPCSAGGGRFEHRGSVWSPSLVTFAIPNSCPMSPREKGMVESLVKPRMKLGSDSPLLAYFPFAVSFWEMADGSDADTSYVVEVVTTGARQQRWTDYQAGKPIQVRLFGRQNSLAPSSDIYQVDVDILKDTDETFKLRILKVTHLDTDGVQRVKKRCQGLQPRRNCGQIFP